jgi:hypothetical protein
VIVYRDWRNSELHTICGCLFSIVDCQTHGSSSIPDIGPAGIARVYPKA